MSSLIQKLNHELGVLICKISRKHREPHSTFKVYPFEVEMCNRCGHIFNKKKIGRTFQEIYRDVYSNSGNQVW